MYEVISLQNNLRWQKVLDVMQIDDVHYTTHYFLSALTLDPGEALMFYYNDELGSVAYPYIKRQVEEGHSNYFDITTPFGYGGPVLRATTDASALAVEFMEVFSNYCKEEGIIAEYIRFHPLYGNASYFKNHLKLIPIYETYTIDLKKFAQTSIARESDAGESEKLVIKKLGTVRHMFDFLVLYYSEVRKREEADSYYFFTEDYFEALVSELGQVLHLFGAFRGSKLVSACYILAEGNVIYHHLDGTIENEDKGETTRALLLKVAEWGAEHNMSYYHLGGDFKVESLQVIPIKKNLANMQPSMFYICEKIHNDIVFRDLVNPEELDIEKRYRNV